MGVPGRIEFEQSITSKEMTGTLAKNVTQQKYLQKSGGTSKQ